MNDSGLSDSIFGGDGDGGEPVGKLPDRKKKDSVTSRAEARRDRVSATPPPKFNHDQVKRRRRSCLVMFLAVVVFVGAGGLAAKSIGSSFLPSFGGGSNGGGDYAGQGDGSVDIIVKQGDSGYSIGRTLTQAGVVKSASTFGAVAGATPEFAKVQPGKYRMKKRMSSQAAVELLLTPSARLSTRVTIPEGLWATEIYALLSKRTNTPLADYTKIKPSQLDLPPAAGGKIEGFLFPSTYDFDPGTSAVDQLRAMVKNGTRQMNALGVTGDQLRDTVIVASIVQGESRLGADGPKVARVVLNRETKKMPLQMDSTIHYLLHKRGTVTTTDQDRNSSSPYNTYKHAGLPPGPINNPGLEALKAAAKPAAGDWLYFVTVNQSTGETKFTADYGQHQRNVAEFRQWCQANPGKC
ncbi:endolytic transglycosylase MltG [Calidifontibacter terrae]